MELRLRDFVGSAPGHWVLRLCCLPVSSMGGVLQGHRMVSGATGAQVTGEHGGSTELCRGEATGQGPPHCHQGGHKRYLRSPSETPGRGPLPALGVSELSSAKASDRERMHTSCSASRSPAAPHPRCMPTPPGTVVRLPASHRVGSGLGLGRWLWGRVGLMRSSGQRGMEMGGRRAGATAVFQKMASANRQK